MTQTQIMGKRAEFKMMGKLMEEGFTIYVPVVDIKGVDCVIEKKGKFSEIQIKSSSKEATQPYNFGGLKVSPRPNYFYLFYVEKEERYWIIPTQKFKDFWNVTSKEGKNRGKVNVDFGSPKGKIRSKFSEYEGLKGLQLLEDN